MELYWASDRTGSGRDPMPSLAYHGAKIQASFIEEFMRLDQGSRASAETQADPFPDLHRGPQRADRARVKTGITKQFVAYNYGPQPGLPRIKNSLIDASSLSELADFALKLTQVAGAARERLEASSGSAAICPRWTPRPSTSAAKTTA